MAKKKDNKYVTAVESTRAPGEGIILAPIVAEMKASYLSYAMSVIVSRALPDVRDGLKPVHRRILYAMSEDGLTHSHRYTKSAGVVGDVLKKYHPHGDMAVYDSIVKMVQDFSSRYPLIDGQGNFGSMDGDNAAAYRYTEVRMKALASEVLKDIEKETVDYVPNYDATRREPIVLPSRVPTVLLNGTLGIAVGMATKIPPHNLREVMQALVHLADNPEATNEDLLEFVQGPDFPTGGIIFNKRDIHHAYSTGRGGVLVRGEAEIIDDKTSQIIITSVPYQVNKAELIIKIANLVHEKKLDGIRDIRDESTTLDDTRVVIDLKQGSYPQKVLNALYKHTDLEMTFHFNMLALVGGVPETLSLKRILEEFIIHRKQVVKRRTEFDLRAAKARAHILEGLKKALDHIDEIIKLIKKSKDVTDARVSLMKTFRFSELQASAILEMKLQKLAGLERKKIEDELRETLALIDELETLLKSTARMLALIKKESLEIAEKYGDDRRTKVVKGGVKEWSAEDIIPDEESMLVLTRGGYIKRTRPDEYKRQRRGGVGVVDLDTKEEDFITILMATNTHADLLFFTDKGKVYQLKMYEIPEGKRATRGKSIMNFLSLSEGERVTSVLPLPKNAKDMAGLGLMMITKKGVGKKVLSESFTDVRRSGIIALKLGIGDELLSVVPVEKGDSVILATRGGQAIRFKESDIRSMGRTAGGVRAMKMRGADEVVGADVVKREQEGTLTFFTMSANGLGKKTKIKEYKLQKRGGSGIKTAKITKKTGQLVVGRTVSIHLGSGTPSEGGGNESEIVAMSKQGQVIRVTTGEVPTSGRQTQGVRVMKLREGDSLASVELL
ncbi:MAG TPA: DNA gyrase subunit A [Candidatus Paceibacterota bacterium]